MLIIQEGQHAPNFQLKANDDSSISLDSFKRQKECGSLFLSRESFVWMPFKKSFQDGSKCYLFISNHSIK